MLDTVKHGFKKVSKSLQDILYNVPEGLMFVIKCSVISIIWITLIT